MKRGSRKGPSKTRAATVRRAWYDAHQEQRSLGASAAASRLVADQAARAAGRGWTKARHASALRAAIQALARCGAAAPARTPAPLPDRKPRNPASMPGNARFLERQRDPRVQDRRRAIAQGDRARQRGELPAIAPQLQRGQGLAIFGAVWRQIKRELDAERGHSRPGESPTGKNFTKSAARNSDQGAAGKLST